MEKITRDIEFEKTKKNALVDVRLVQIILIFFIGLSLFLRLFIKARVSFYIPIIFVVWSLIYIANSYFLKRTRSLKDIHDIHFRDSMIDLFILTVILHFIQGIEWLGAITYIIVFASAFPILPEKKLKILTFTCIALYVGLCISEFFGLVPHYKIFDLREGLYKDSVFFISTSALVVSFLFFFGEMGSSFSSDLKKRTIDLIKAKEEATRAYEEAEGAKQVLEVRVRARTKELKELAESLEKKVEKRTEELQEKMEELQKFNKLSIGREIKMVELKDEIEYLKEKLKQKNG